jgi:ribosomal protein S18 acetylase RimI-like enzyme
VDLLASMDANLAAHAGHLHPYAPGMSVRDTPQLYVADSGLPDDTFNIVARARLGGDRDPGAAIADALATLAPGRPYTWWIGPASTPVDLSTRLAAAGWPETGREVAMAARLAPTPPPPVETTLRVRVAGSPAELADFAAVVAANWTPPAATVREFFAVTARAALDPGCASRYLVGYDGDRPVAAAEVCLAAGVAGVYNVCTLVADRGRGHGSALTAAALAVAVARGCRTAVLQASTQGERIYRRLGFRAVGEYAEHAVSGRLTTG